MAELVKSGRRLKLVDVCSPLDLHKSNQPRSKGTSRDAWLTFTCIYRFVRDALDTTRRASCQLGWIRLSRKFYQKLRGGGAKGRNFDEICGRSEARRRALPYRLRRYALPRAAISFFSTANICIGGAFRCCTRGTGIESQAATRRTEQLFEARLLRKLRFMCAKEKQESCGSAQQKSDPPQLGKQASSPSPTTPSYSAGYGSTRLRLFRYFCESTTSFQLGKAPNLKLPSHGRTNKNLKTALSKVV
jgi:hypothetical protein